MDLKLLHKGAAFGKQECITIINEDHTMIVMCDMRKCKNELEDTLMASQSDGETTWYACPDCADTVEDKTGYCSLQCQYTGRCDQSC